jgi:hypothetical protein
LLPSLENRNIIPQFQIAPFDLFDVTSHSPHLHMMSHGNSDETNSGSKMRPHDKFTPDEDAKLMVLVAESTQPDWFAVALQSPGRSARQCKDRWQKYLSPDIKRCAWTPSEDGILRDRYEELGPKWARIAAFLPNRTDSITKTILNVGSVKGDDVRPDRSVCFTAPKLVDSS